MSNGSKWVLNFIVFIVIMAGKDLLTKYQFSLGLNLFQILFFSGVGCLVLTTAFEAGSERSFKAKNLRVQIFRLFLNGFAWGTAILTYKYLNAGTIAVISKANTPLLILIAPLLGVKYSKKQSALAALAAGVLLAFAFIVRSDNEHPIGFFLVALTVLLVCMEYVLLSRSATQESAFVVTAVPAASCALFATGGALITNSPLFVPPDLLWLATMGGMTMFLFYALSIRRYKMLPLGISELPALFSAFLIVGAEWNLFSVKPTQIYLFFLVLITAILTGVAWLRATSAKPA